MFTQNYDPIGHSLGLSTIFAVLPLLVIFLLLGVLKMRAQWAALIALAVSIIVAVAVYSMPIGQTLSAAGEGAAFGIFPIMWIVVNAIWLYTMTVGTGHFDVLRRSFGAISEDQRVQAIIIAFCFGALLEALAGFGTPVAITSVMLIALGFSKLKAAAVALVANTAPVAFGALAVPITTLAKITGLPEHDLASTVGRQTPVLALIVPLALVFMVDGRRGVKQTWLPALLSGVVFAILQFLCSNYVSIPLTDIIAALGAALTIVMLLRFWQPAEILVRAEHRTDRLASRRCRKPMCRHASPQPKLPRTLLNSGPAAAPETPSPPPWAPPEHTCQRTVLWPPVVSPRTAEPGPASTKGRAEVLMILGQQPHSVPHRTRGWRPATAAPTSFGPTRRTSSSSPCSRSLNSPLSSGRSSPDRPASRGPACTSRCRTARPRRRRRSRSLS